MSYILYYSTRCKNCDKILGELSRTEIQSDIHFVCVDKRVTKADGSICVVLDTGEEILLPKEITRVPAMLMLRHNNRVIYGNDIYTVLGESLENEKRVATGGRLEPNELDCGFRFGMGSISSNTYSSLDGEEDESLSGCYVSACYDNVGRIETPPDDYQPDKMDEVSIKTYQEERNMAVPMNIKQQHQADFIDDSQIRGMPQMGASGLTMT